MTQIIKYDQEANNYFEGLFQIVTEEITKSNMKELWNDVKKSAFGNISDKLYALLLVPTIPVIIGVNRYIPDEFTCLNFKKTGTLFKPEELVPHGLGVHFDYNQATRELTESEINSGKLEKKMLEKFKNKNIPLEEPDLIEIDKIYKTPWEKSPAYSLHTPSMHYPHLTHLRGYKLRAD